MPKNWTEPELWVAMNIYCRLPFGQFDQSNGYIKTVAERMGRTPGSLAMKLSNLASLDSYHQQRGVSGLPGASNLDRKVWNDFQTDWSSMAERSEAAFETLMGGQVPVVPEPSKVPTAPEGPTEVQRLVRCGGEDEGVQSIKRNFENI